MKPKLSALLTMLALTLAACGSGGATSDPTSGSTITTTPAGTTPGPTQPSTAQPSGGNDVVGWFEVDGVRVDATQPFRCPSPFPSPGPDDFRAGVRGRSADESYIFEVQESSGGIPLIFIFSVNGVARQYQNELLHDQTSLWFSARTEEVLSDFTYSNDGTRLKGGPVPIPQSLPDEAEGVVVVSFDIPLPTELSDQC